MIVLSLRCIKKAPLMQNHAAFFHLALPYWDYTINFQLGSKIFCPGVRRLGLEIEFNSQISSILSRFP